MQLISVLEHGKLSGVSNPSGAYHANVQHCLLHQLPCELKQQKAAGLHKSSSPENVIWLLCFCCHIKHTPQGKSLNLKLSGENQLNVCVAWVLLKIYAITAKHQLQPLQFNNSVFGQRIVHWSSLKQESVTVQNLFNQFHGLDTLSLANGYQLNCCMEMFSCSAALVTELCCLQQPSLSSRLMLIYTFQFIQDWLTIYWGMKMEEFELIFFQMSLSNMFIAEHNFLGINVKIYKLPTPIDL